MATTTSSNDYFSRSARPSVLGSARTPGAGPGAGQTTPGSPRTPRTPLLSRSLSSQFGSPGGLRAEPEDVIVYELHERYVTAGYAGESRPRCFVRFNPESGRRVGDWRAYDYSLPSKESVKKEIFEQWAGDRELYRADVRSLDLGLVEDKLDRAVRTAHTDHLQLDNKPRKVVLVAPSLFPTPLLDVVLRVLFSHFTQPPSVVLLTKPIMSCVAAGLRHGLVVEVGWEETVVTTVGEYKEILQRRTVRGGKMLVQEMKRVLDEAAGNDNTEAGVSYDDAEQVTDRMAYCRPSSTHEIDDSATTTLPLFSEPLTLPFSTLSAPAETTFFPPLSHHDDHETPLPLLLYQTLLALPLELRALCLTRITLTGPHSSLPGLKTRLLLELTQQIRTRGWDPIASYGSATGKNTSRILRDRSTNLLKHSPDSAAKGGRKVSAPPSDPIAPLLPPASERKHDHVNDRVTLKAEKELWQRKARRNAEEVGVVRGVETRGAWAGASLVGTLRVKGVWEVEREEFLRNGLGEIGAGGGIL